ncbi:MAG: HDOD domain-containing protein, partial [Planctomycetes bacterium]|nr:HDOD domain-containing protein [Planctomycetota bacterium]
MADNSIFRSGKDDGSSDLSGDAGAASIFRSNSAVSHKHLREAELIAAINDLPALSAVVTSILSKVDDELSSAADLEELVKQDMVIAGRLIKLVNSP